MISLAVFLLVYLGMLLGGLPFLKLDRTGIALLGAIALVASQSMSVDEAYRSLNMPTLILLFSFMVISAQLRLGGFYTRVILQAGSLDMPPSLFLAASIAVSAALSAVFSNDIVCLSLAPALAEICLARRLDPVPFLIGLACSANIGSAATLIGNPQNMTMSLVATWAVIFASRKRRGWISPESARTVQQDHAFDPWQTGKGLAVAILLFAAFLFTPWPRDLMALAGAGILLTSRRLHSQKTLGLVDWQLLILFMGLFVVNHAMQQTGLPSRLVNSLASHGFDLGNQGPLFISSVFLSNVVSNVPAVMLLLPTTIGEHAATVLALSSTLAGNFLIVGSIANLIVVNEAERKGIRIGWKEHAGLGIPVGLITLLLTYLYLSA